MTLALAGIVSLQVFWLKTAVQAEQKKYADDLRRAMENATAHLETGEALTLITDAFLPKITHDTVFEDDSVVIHASPGKIRVTHKHPHPGDDSLISMRQFPDLPGMPDVPMPPGPPNVFVKVDSNIDCTEVVMLNREKRLKSAVKQVYLQYIDQDGKVSDRLTTAKIGDALRESFRNAGIRDSFDFAVFDAQKKRYELFSDSTKTNAYAAGELRVPLFPSDLHAGMQQLVVVPESGTAHLVRVLWPQFLVALLLTTVLVLVFWLTFREALRQKKISDIRNDFINNMTHEFKTPIATISLAVDTMINPAVIHDEEKLRHYAALIRRENRRMNDQVEKVLELALAERKELQLAKEKISPRELLEHAVSSMNLQAAAKHGSLSLELHDLPETIYADPFHLERAITNLLDNALKYSGDAPVITVSASCEKNQLKIAVADNGKGISEEEQGRIFDRFYRVSTGNRHDVKGFGLGLSYVKTIVEMHSGAVSVSSKPGKGSTFTITINL